MNVGLFGMVTEQAARWRFRWDRIETNADWILPVAVVVLVMLTVRSIYRRDAAELRPSVGRLLATLRTLVFFGLLILYLQPKLWTEVDYIRNSRVVLLIDASRSMGIVDADAPATDDLRATRIEQVASGLEKTKLIDRLRAEHDVAIVRFDETGRQVAALAKRTEAGAAVPPVDASETGSAKTPDAWNPETILQLSGKETRLGQSLRQLLADEHGKPVAGVVLISDGGQNAGPPPDQALDAAREAKIRIHTIGAGTLRRPVNVAIQAVEAPKQAHPGDPYTATVLLQSQGFAGKSVAVRLRLRDTAKGSERDVESRPATLGADGEVVPVKFQVTPTETGRYQLIAKIDPPQGDGNADDDRRETSIEIVDRKTKVLLFAGGPSREYQFLRAMLARDKTVSVHILLRTNRGGISQEGAEILDRFPATRKEMFEYHCVIAIDPPWNVLKPDQVDLLETWVGEQGGGMIVIPGPVHAGQGVGGWVQDPAMSKIRALYPVEFFRRFVPSEGETADGAPQPIVLTREGREVEFLGPVGNDGENADQTVWKDFEGVYQCFPVRGPKPGATVFARLADSDRLGGELPRPFMASQFYGSGRVFYLGSGEMWRLRKLDDRYFEQFYTRLVRQVSQGRLLRQSDRGVLLVGKERYWLGNTVEVRAQLTNSQFQPLTAAEVLMEVIRPDRSIRTLALRADADRPGMFLGQLTAQQEGEYRLELPIPESDHERLTRRIRVNLPDLERETLQRNEPLLRRIAQETGGVYYESLAAACADSDDAIFARLKGRPQVTTIASAVDPAWEETWLRWLMAVLCGLLCAEWCIRRFMRLA